MYILRHGKLLLPYQGHEDMPFAVFASLGRGDLDPVIDPVACRLLMRDLEGKIPFPLIRKMLVSPSQRSQSTGKFLAEYIATAYSNAVDVVVVPELREVYFDLERILSNTSGTKFDINELNNTVFQAMLNGNGADSVKEIYTRAQAAIQQLIANGTAIAITHDFFMRVLELCIRAHEAKREVTLEDLCSTQRNGYLRGFATDKTLKMLLSI